MNYCAYCNIVATYGKIVVVSTCLIIHFLKATAQTGNSGKSCYI